ncbi:Gfo/Idh/MocA family protein [Fodinicola acaciae]|uniref:Gfo/Idh/MocA family protein n=1 Tax=Fodinicola acaciae TaxID=2681555 RepID=UPI001C9E568A|nr:Gfo/Idh/MocA family oxidoreductase [Fodinicola acaciae]
MTIPFPEPVLRVGVIGAGAMGEHHAETLAFELGGCQVVAVADLDRDRAGRVAEKIGCDSTDDATAVIADPAVDALVIASADATHEPYVLACLERGKPVLCEKPLAPDADAAGRIMAAEVEVGRRLIQVGFMRRYDADYRRMKAAVDGRALGQPLLMHCVHRNQSAGADFHSAWMITSSVSHEIEALRWLTGSEIVSATAVLPRSVLEHVFDPQLVLLRTAEGVVADVEIFARAQYGYEVRAELVLERGTVSIGMPAGAVVRTAETMSTAVPPGFIERFAPAYRRQLHDWIQSVRSERPAGASAWDGFATAIVADACIASQRGGGTVPVSLPERPALYH